MENVGDRFQRETKYFPERMEDRRLDWSAKPEVYKSYPGTAKVALPTFTPEGLMPLDAALRQRRSVREFLAEPLSLGQVAYLLWASTGIARTEGGYEFRTAPSAGALYPTETYLVANEVETLKGGLYHYAIRSHELEQLVVGDLRHAVASAALGQVMCAEAAAVFVWSAVFERAKWKYGQRAYRYIYLEAGHIAENLALAAAGMALGSCQIGALFDDEVNKIIGLDGDSESVIYMSAVGVPA